MPEAILRMFSSKKIASLELCTKCVLKFLPRAEFTILSKKFVITAATHLYSDDDKCYPVEILETKNQNKIFRRTAAISAEIGELSVFVFVTYEGKFHLPDMDIFCFVITFINKQ